MDESMRLVNPAPRVLAALVAVTAALTLAACTGSGGGKAESSSSASESAAGDAASIAASFQRRAASWATTIQNSVDKIADYPDQIDAKHNSATQIATQTEDCGTVENALGTASRPPV